MPGTVWAPAPLLPCSQAPAPCSSGRVGGSHGDSVPVIQYTLWHKQGQHKSAIMQVVSSSGQNAVTCTQGNTVLYVGLLC